MLRAQAFVPVLIHARLSAPQLVVFFLPLLIAILSALGLSHRLPQRDIHPETGKISQDDIEKHSKLVYYTPAESNAEEKLVRSNSEVPEQQDANVRRGQRSFAPSTSTDAEIAVQTPLPLSRSPSVKEQTGGSFRAPDRTSTQTDEVPQSKRRRIGRLIGLSRRTASGASPHAGTQKEKSNVIAGLSAPRRQHGETNLGSVRYPLYPVCVAVVIVVHRCTSSVVAHRSDLRPNPVRFPPIELRARSAFATTKKFSRAMRQPLRRPPSSNR